jgi:metallo-beta-lactamase class B
MLTKFRTGMALCLAAATFGASGARAQLPDDYSRHVVAAKNASLFDWTGVFARICVAPKTGPAIGNYGTDPGRAVYYAEPQKVFDNLYFLGTKFHTAWALKTSDGIILIDTLYNYAIEPEIVDGLKKEGLDPAQVKYVLITHGHSDHDEGAAYFQQKYGAHVMLGGPDWDVLAKAKRPMPGGTPRRDLVAQDGGKITLGDTTVTTILTPGHTPGAYGLIFQVTDHGKPITVAYASGTAFTAYDKTFFDTFVASQKKLAAAAATAGASVLISNHTAFDEAWTKARLAAWRPEGEPNPFVIGAAAVQNYFKVMEECSLAWESLPPSAPSSPGE